MTDERFPQTAEEIAAFEERFSEEIAKAAARIPTLIEVEARAKHVWMRIVGVRLRSEQPAADD